MGKPRRRKAKPPMPTALVVKGPYLGAKVYLSAVSRATGCYCIVDGSARGRWIRLSPGQIKIIKPLASEPTWRRRIEVRL